MSKGRSKGRSKSRKSRKSKKTGKSVNKVRELPAHPKKGVIYEKTVNGKNGRRKVGFVYTGKSGFGKWKIVYNRPKRR